MMYFLFFCITHTGYGTMCVYLCGVCVFVPLFYKYSSVWIPRMYVFWRCKKSSLRQCPLSIVYNMPQCHIEFSPTNFGNSKYKMYSKNQFNNLQNTMQFFFCLFFLIYFLLLKLRSCTGLFLYFAGVLEAGLYKSGIPVNCRNERTSCSNNFTLASSRARSASTRSIDPFNCLRSFDAWSKLFLVSFLKLLTCLSNACLSFSLKGFLYKEIRRRLDNKKMM